MASSINLVLTPHQAAAALAACDWVYGAMLCQGESVPGCSRLMLLRAIGVLTDACLAGEPSDPQPSEPYDERDQT